MAPSGEAQNADPGARAMAVELQDEFPMDFIAKIGISWDFCHEEWDFNGSFTSSTI